MSTEAAPQPPLIPDYELLRLIGRGAYGEVWLARGVTGIYRAVKLVWRDRFPDPAPYEREFRGLKEFAAISLSESRQLALLHVGRDPAAAYFYYVMELADDAVTGRAIDPPTYAPLTLKEMRARRGRLPPSECVTIGVELARALASLHARGLIHRDIKPSNVIIVGGAPKLADIGLVTEASAALTFVGTEGFVPPEGPGAPGADVFALGKLLYELATGLDRHDYPRLPPDLHDWPDRKEALELNEVLIRACEPHPSRRHADATALLDDLLLLQAGRSVRRLRRAERQVSRALRLGVLLALIAAIAGLGAYLERQRANSEMSGRLAAEAERDALARQAVYSATLAQAQRALDQDDLARARRLLDTLVPRAGETDLRGFEWRALRHEAEGDPALVLRESGPGVDRVTLSPDESLLAVHDTGSTVAIHDVATQREVRRIANVRELAGFSSDGKWLVGTSADGGLQRWSTTTGEPDGAAAPGRFRALAAQGSDRAVALQEGRPEQLVLWDFAARRATDKIDFQPPGEALPWVLFRTGADASSGTVAIASVRGGGSRAEFRLTRVAANGRLTVQHTELGRQRPSAVGVDSHGAWAALDISGEVWRATDGAWVRTTGSVPPGTRRVEETGAGSNRRIVARLRRVIWQDPAGPAGVARGHGGTITDLALSRKHGLIYSAATDGGVRAWPLQGPSRPRALQAWDNNAGASGVVFSSDGQRLCVPMDGHSCAWLEVATLTNAGPVENLQFPLVLTPNGVLGVGDRGIQLAGPGGASRTVLDVSPSAIRVAAATPDGRQVAAIDQAGDLRGNGEVVAPQLQRYFLVRFDPAGRRLWLTGTNRDLRCLSWPDGRELWRVTLPAIAPDIRLLPGEAQLVIALENGSLEVRATADGTLVRTLDAGSAAPQAMAVAPDGSRLFVGGVEGEIHCFALADWRYLHALSIGAGQRLHVLACSPDGRTLAALTKTGTLHVVRTQ